MSAAPQLDPATAAKLSTAKQKKETGDQAFKLAQVKDALRSYHEALMYLVGMDKSAMKGLGVPTPQASGDAVSDAAAAQEKTEVDELVEKIYANMAACHLKQGNWKRATETADKALAKNANNYKALFRKAKGLGELGFFERAVKILEELKVKNPSDAALCDVELTRLRALDREREKAHNQKLKGFLTRKEGEKKATRQPSPPKDP